jgi:hypothetical protein
VAISGKEWRITFRYMPSLLCNYGLQRYQEVAVYSDNTKIHILLRLGAPKGNIWPNYPTLYGFIEEDVKLLINLFNDGKFNDQEVDNTETWTPVHALRIFG